MLFPHRPIFLSFSPGPPEKWTKRRVALRIADYPKSSWTVALVRVALPPIDLSAKKGVLEVKNMITRWKPRVLWCSLLYALTERAKHFGRFCRSLRIGVDYKSTRGLGR